MGNCESINPTIINAMVYVSVIIGAIAYLLLDLLGSVGVGVFSRRYLSITLSNIIAGCAIAWAIDIDSPERNLFVFDATRLTAIYLGFSGQKLFKILTDLFDRKIKTTIGINN